MIIFPGGVRQKRNFQRGGGVRFVRRYLENPEGRGGHRKNPFRGGGYGYFLELHITLLMLVGGLACILLAFFAYFLKSQLAYEEHFH